jgi:hypothetical protein
VTAVHDVHTKIKVKFPLCFIKQHAINSIWEWSYKPTHFNLGTGWRRIFSFTLQPIHPPGKFPWYLLDGKLSEPQIRPSRFGEDKNISSSCHPVQDLLIEFLFS